MRLLVGCRGRVVGIGVIVGREEQCREGGRDGGCIEMAMELSFDDCMMW